jgi:hypothetical protein
VPEKHPYTSGPTGLTQTVAQFRRSLPAQVTSDTLKKLSIAPNNEGYVLNIMRFIGVLDSTNKRTADALAVFNKHDDSEFQLGFAKLVETAYHDLFELHGEDAWTLPAGKLISYFRSTDHTSDLVGKRQASTFSTLANIAGKVESVPRQAATKSKRSETSEAASKSARPGKPEIARSKKNSEVLPPPELHSTGSAHSAGKSSTDGNPMALTVRIEINLPAGGDQETYDRIFKSIRANLLNGDVA